MTEKYLSIINRNICCKINVSDVRMIRKSGRKLIVVANDETLECYRKMEEIEPYLDKDFFKCLQSCYINFSHVIKMKENTIYFDSGEKLYLGRDKYVKAKQVYCVFLRESGV